MNLVMPLAFIYFEFELAATPGIFVDAHVLCFTAAGGGTICWALRCWYKGCRDTLPPGGHDLLGVLL